MKRRGKVHKKKNNWIVVKMNEKAPEIGDYIEVKWGKTRSLDQNSFYWKYLDWVIQDGGLEGYDREELHDAFKRRFLVKKEFTAGKIKLYSYKSTSDLTISEFAEYFDRVDNVVNDVLGINTAPFHAEYEKFWAKH